MAERKFANGIPELGIDFDASNILDGDSIDIGSEVVVETCFEQPEDSSEDHQVEIPLVPAPHPLIPEVDAMIPVIGNYEQPEDPVHVIFHRSQYNNVPIAGNIAGNVLIAAEDGQPEILGAEDFPEERGIAIVARGMLLGQDVSFDEPDEGDDTSTEVEVASVDNPEAKAIVGKSKQAEAVQEEKDSGKPSLASVTEAGDDEEPISTRQMRTRRFAAMEAASSFSANAKKAPRKRKRNGTKASSRPLKKHSTRNSSAKGYVAKKSRRPKIAPKKTGEAPKKRGRPRSTSK